MLMKMPTEMLSRIWRFICDGTNSAMYPLANMMKVR